MRGASVAAIERVYRERGRDFYRFALARLGDREAAHDAVQEGFARAIRARGSYRGSGSLDAWIASCVVNAARDQKRRPPADELVDGGVDAEVALPNDDLRSAVRELPLRQREALFLRFYLDLDYAQIADALGVEVGTVSATLHAARARLEQLLSEVTT